jgi:hypothetical protein
MAVIDPSLQLDQAGVALVATHQACFTRPSSGAELSGTGIGGTS